MRGSDMISCEEMDEMIIFPDFDDCVAGYCIRFGQPLIIIYDYPKVIEKLISEGMNEEEALDWFNFNTIGTWAGETTPAFLIPKDYNE